MAALQHIRLVCSNSRQLLGWTGKVVAQVNAQQPSERLVVSVRPSLLSQLSAETVNVWSRICADLYTGLQANVVVAFHDCDDLAVDREIVVEGSDLAEAEAEGQLYHHVVLGGTFDRLHPGHKILLSSALLRCDRRLTVGVTARDLLSKKVLPELIQPVRQRMEGVESFLTAVRPEVERNIVEIPDPFGPSIVLPELQCIVGSQETERGCQAVNARRAEAGLAQLDTVLINMAEDAGRLEGVEEEKISSSSGRIRLLGSRLQPPLRSWQRDSGPYLLGLTGGSASGKTSVGRRLERAGWGVVDCDKLGHQAYTPGQPAYTNLVSQFGEKVLSEDGSVNRRVLGGIVFSDKEKLAQLNSIVWPEIERLALEQAHQLWTSGCPVVVLDAAVLLEAGWETSCHEVWVCVVPREEAVARIMARDGKTEEEATRRIESQLSNQARVERASTVFSTLWAPEFTQKQVEAAVGRLGSELAI